MNDYDKANSSRRRIAIKEAEMRPQHTETVRAMRPRTGKTHTGGVTGAIEEATSQYSDWEVVWKLANQLGVRVTVLLVLVLMIVIEALLIVVGPLHNVLLRTCRVNWTELQRGFSDHQDTVEQQRLHDEPGGLCEATSGDKEKELEENPWDNGTVTAATCDEEAVLKTTKRIRQRARKRHREAPSTHPVTQGDLLKLSPMQARAVEPQDSESDSESVASRRSYLNSSPIRETVAKMSSPVVVAPVEGAEPAEGGPVTTSLLASRNLYRSTTKVPLPDPGRPPYFKGKTNITQFLEDWEWMCSDCGLKGEDKRKRFLRYMDAATASEIKTFDEYQEAGYDESRFYKALRKQYIDKDSEAQKYTLTFLNVLCEQMRLGKIDCETYINTYHHVSEVLSSRGELLQMTRVDNLVRALPKLVKDYFFSNIGSSFDIKDVSTYNYPKALEVVRRGERIHTMEVKFAAKLDPTVTGTVEDQVSRVLSVAPSVPPFGSATQDSGPLKALTNTYDQQQASRSENIALVSKMEEITKGLSQLQIQMAAAFQEPQANPGPGYYGAPRGGGGGRSGRGEWNPRQGQGQPSQQEPTGHVNMVQGGQQYSGQNFGARFSNNRICYGCLERDWNGVVMNNVNHSHTTQCPLMNELRNKGCCHYDLETRKWYLGTHDGIHTPNPIMFSSDQPWAHQVRLKVAGTAYDYDVSKRAQNIANQQEQVRVGAEACTVGGSINCVAASNQVVSIARRPKAEGNYVGAMDEQHQPLEDYFEPLPEWDVDLALEEIGVNAVATNKRKAGHKSVQETLRDRARKEEQFPKAKTQRQTMVTPRRAADRDMPMEVDSSDDDVEEILRVEGQVEATQSTQSTFPPEDQDLPPRRAVKLTAPLPRTAKGLASVIQALKTPDPAEALRLQYLRETAHYTHLFEMAGAVKGEMTRQLRMLEVSPETINQLSNSFKRLTKASPVAVEGNAASVEPHDYASLVNNRWLVVAPRLQCILMGSRNRTHVDAMLDSGAECNILPYEVARNIGCPIQQVKNFSLSSVTGETFHFAGVAKIKVYVDVGVSCETAFFLIKKSPKILLGQPFIALMKVNFNHNKDGSIDGIFNSPDDNGQRCSVMVVPPLKNRQRWKPQGRPAYVESETESEEEEN
jgi:hypothetical protein